MNTIGCVFCEKVGNVSALNQHIRSFQDASRTSRHARGSDHHNMEIVQAFYSLTAKRQPEFIQATSVDRLTVLNEFASSITKHLKSDAEADKWRKRDFYPRRANWWARQITVVLEMYRASGRLPQLLSAHVKNIIDKSITESLLNADEDDNDDDDEPHFAARVPRKLDAGRSQLLAMASASGAFMPAPQNDLTMQYTGSQHGTRLGMDANITNKPTRKWFNNLSPADNAAAGPSSEPKIYLRKRGSNPTFNNAREDSISRSTEYVTISDEEQDDHDDDQASRRMTPPPTIQPSKRGKTTATARASSSTLPASRITAAKDPRSVSGGALLSSGPPLRAASPDGMAPFLLLHVTGLTNTVHTIPISYGTTMDQALALALRFAPRVVRENNVPVRFFGDPGSHWEGDWPECRWDSVMDSAMTQRVEVFLRLIMLE